MLPYSAGGSERERLASLPSTLMLTAAENKPNTCRLPLCIAANRKKELF
jgi:hypothetical protein